MGIDGLGNGELFVSGDVSLGGEIDITDLGSFNPYHDEVFTVIEGTDSGSFSGFEGFDASQWLEINNTNSVQIEFLGNAVQRSGVPDEASTAVLLGVTLVGIGLGRRRLKSLGAC